METERYVLNIINTFLGKDPVKEKFNTFDELNGIRELFEERVTRSIDAFTLKENFANPSDKNNIMTIIYTILISLVLGFLVGFFIVAFSAFNMSWAYNKALGKSDLETSYWAALCFVFFILYFPYYGIILQPLRIKSQDSITSTISTMVTPFIQVGLPTWEWMFSGMFSAQQ
jgi:NhaP-type Na+/H+ or K+/H+ antiporter